MHRLKRICALALVGVLALSVLSGCKNGNATSSSASGSSSEPAIEVDLDAVDDICMFLSDLKPDEVVATAGDISVTAGELIYWIISRYDARLMNFYYYGQFVLPWEKLEVDEDVTLSQVVLAEAMQYAMTQRVVEKKALAAGYKVKQEDKDAVQTTLDALETEAKAQGVTAEMFLKEAGLTENLFVWNCEVDYLYGELSDALFGDGSANPPTEAGIRAYKEQAGYYKVKHILRATQDLTTGAALDDTAKAQKKAQAEDLLNQLKQSSDPKTLFDQLMNEHSEDPGLATSPEGYEFQTNTSVDPIFEEAALALKEGEISGVVEGASGYHIILRLPMEVDMEVDKAAYIGYMMSEQVDQWILEAGLKTTDTFEKLNPETIYERMIAYSDALYERISANTAK